ncbi:hypothetical protein RHGRI_020361 [Rhododendron griersonianum]|uniref:Reverse transcriptase domain-containing protein n=1 Tax=Rhododendron griersonianum TaxID=479676 RepID=A0AAV6JI19_9ERIC|nr:hypothetical protein RHGRI_020361 [Rhododendron griersonianum]
MAEMKSTTHLNTQAITEIKNSTHIAITKLENQMGQLANQVAEREKGKFPSQTLVNPKGQFSIGTTSTSSNEQHHVQSIITLRSGKEVDNKVSMPTEELAEAEKEENTLVENTFVQSSYEDPLEACLAHFGCEFDIDESIEQVNALLDAAPLMSIDEWQPKVVPLSLSTSPSLPSIVEPPKLELKPLPNTLKYKFLGPCDTLPVIIASDLDDTQEQKLLNVLKEHKEAIGWSINDIKGVSPSLVMHRIHLEENAKTSREPQRRLNPAMQEVVRAEILKLLDAGVIYPISDSNWVSPVQVVPKKSGVTVVKNEDNELVPTRVQTGWRVCIDYRKLNSMTRKDHFPLPFIDQMLERLAGHEYYCFLDGYSGYNQIPIAPEDQEKTTFTCPYGTFAYRRMPFGLCNAPATFHDAW